jgi:hypothetical protein
MEKLPLGMNLNCTWMTIGWHFTTCTGTFFLWITNQPRWSPLGPYQKFCFKSLHWNNWTIQRRLIYEFTETTGPFKGDLSMSSLKQLDHWKETYLWVHWNNWTIQRRLIYEFTKTTGPLKGDLSMSSLKQLDHWKETYLWVHWNNWTIERRLIYEFTCVVLL